MTDVELKEELLKIGNSSEVDFDKLDAIFEKIEDSSDVSQFIPDLFMVIENHPDVDFGSPGEIVHILEKQFRHGYEAGLLASIKRKPTIYTVWMLNRLINGVEGDEKKKYFEVMQYLASQKNTDADVRNAANEFLS